MVRVSQATAFCLQALPGLVSAHGYLKSITANGQNYLAWQVGQDDYLDPPPARYARKLANNGPVPDFTTEDITCGAGGNEPAGGTIELKAGDTVTLNWDQWGSSHSGPVMNYIAHCPNDDCQSFKGNTGNAWVKISERGYEPSEQTPWASDLLRELGARWRVTIPPTLAPGEYLLRHEILGLHVAGDRMGAQFYPSCTQIRVTAGGSTKLPEGVALPGAYDPDDTEGILVELWRINSGQVEYVVPGGPVWSEAAPDPNR
ncbi:related to cel1 protein precursor [Cephalotrichum gorgonifer]|uniref:lytic cellulose monooxygenase (C4-dehydrogenating) n=1 Tax=Cephalotrichum gorgonifer TaxID=2041049 RepID=A0AAE8N1M6_9PEZI|nr:related to cel1 protein precursor [Cephalotrichum gorgonifer]